MSSGDTVPTVVEPLEERSVDTVHMGSATAVAVALASAGKSNAGELHPSSTTTVASPRDAMQLQEVKRVRAFMLFSSLMCGMVAGLVPLLGKDPVATLFLAGSCGVTALVAFVLLRITREPARYRTWMTTFFSVVAATAVIGGYYFFGVASAVMMLVPLGTYLLALGEDFTSALVAHVYVSVSHAVLSVLQIAGVLPDVGLVSVVSDATAERIGILAVTQVVLLAAFVMAREMRSATVSTLKQLNEAVSDNARRSALLNEAKQELALARKVGGAGRFSEQVFGGYRLGTLLGRGAMGEVYEAVHDDSGDLAAVKVLTLDAMRRPELVSRFIREIKISQALHSENIVAVLAVSDSDGEIPFLAMERLRGVSLSDKLREEFSMGLPDVAQLITAVANGLEAAHAVGIVHRDLKPSNLFWDERGTRRSWKILDFGVSRFMDEGDTLTAGAVVGTPSYMAPEQAKGQGTSARSDIYSLGVIAYRTLTGHPAFTGLDLPMVLHSVVYDMPPRPSDVAGVPEDVDLILAMAMAKKPAHRFASASEFAEALSQVAEGELSDELRERGSRHLLTHPWGY